MAPAVTMLSPVLSREAPEPTNRLALLIEIEKTFAPVRVPRSTFPVTTFMVPSFQVTLLSGAITTTAPPPISIPVLPARSLIVPVMPPSELITKVSLAVAAPVRFSTRLKLMAAKFPTLTVPAFRPVKVQTV